VEPHFFQALADFAGPAYLRYSFTRGTEQEVQFLVAVLGLAPGDRVLDVGCGPGRHAHALARRGLEVVGVDISARFVDLAASGAPPGATFLLGDARRLPFEAEFDAAISLCQGAFGLLGGEEDHRVLEEMARAVRPGGTVAVSGFSAYFQVRFLEGGERFDADRGVLHEVATVRNDSGEERAFDLWTTGFTPRELRLLARAAGLEPVHVWSVTPGAYDRRLPDLEHPEFLLMARRPE
jgi:SAM-dependent methyltransferase